MAETVECDTCACDMQQTKDSNYPKLAEIFEQSWQGYEALENSDEPTTYPTFQHALQKTIRMLEEATLMVSHLDLFSSNEDLDEIPTAYLRYLLLPAMLGCLSMKLKESRLEVVGRSKIYFKDFLCRCRQYGITQEEVPDLEDLESRSVPREGPPNLRAMQANREEKIHRYKQSKEMAEKLKALGTQSELRNKPEDVQREFYILCLKKWVNTALDELTGIQQEMEILQHMERLKTKQAEGTNAEAIPPKDKPRQPMKPFILTRDVLQSQVFGAGYPSIPTMTLEEYYQKEIAEGKILPSSRNPSSHSEKETAERKEQQREEEIEQDDAEALRKARELDEFKDTHKRGCGNRENMG